MEIDLNSEVDLSSEIARNTLEIFEALQRPGAFLPGAFKELARLKQALRGFGIGGGSIGDTGPSNIDSIAPEMNEAGQATDSFRDKLKKLWVMLNQSDAHVFTHKMGQLREALEKIKKSAKDIVSPFKKAFKSISSTISSFASKTKNLWNKIASIFKKGVKDCEKPMSSLKSSLRGFLSMFGLYKLGDIFVEGTKQAIKYEAALMTVKRTLGGASKALIDFANTNAQAFGISKSQVMEFVFSSFSFISSYFLKLDYSHYIT